MTLNLLSLATVKTQLGITDTTYDTSITAMLPLVSTDVRQILCNEYDRYILCRFSTESNELKSSWDIDLHGKRRQDFTFDLGTVVTHDYLPDDTYIESYDAVNHIYMLSATPTGTGDHCYPTIKISQWRTIAKMIYYRISKTSTDMPEKEITQKGMGPLSITFRNSAINHRWDYPQALIDDLGVPYQRIG